MLQNTQQRIIISVIGLRFKKRHTHTQVIIISMLGLGLKTQKGLCLIC